jgi:hypothetical protein
MGAKANQFGTAGLLAALERSKTLTLDTTSRRRPAFWNCYSCGNRLDRFDRCKFHEPGPELRRRMVEDHVTGGLCGCAFCESVLERESRGATRAQAIGEVASEFAGRLPVEAKR